MKRQLQVTSEGTNSRSVNHVFGLPGGKRHLRDVLLGRGIDCLHTSLKLPQCPLSGAIRMSTGTPSSPTLFDYTTFIVLMLRVQARERYFATSKL